jgi:hypothetical protein
MTTPEELYYLISLLNSKWVIGDMEGFDDALLRLYELRYENRSGQCLRELPSVKDQQR